MSRIFWDTNLFIYLIEDQAEHAEKVEALLKRMIEREDDTTDLRAHSRRGLGQAHGDRR